MIKQTLSPLEYRRFIVWVFPTVIDMLSVLNNRWHSIEHETYADRITTRIEKRKGKEVTCYDVKPLDKELFIQTVNKEGFTPIIMYLINTLTCLTPDHINDQMLYTEAHDAISVLPDSPELPTSSNPDEIYQCLEAMRYVITMGFGNLEKFNKICVYLAKVSLETLNWFLCPTQTISYGKIVTNETNKNPEN